VDTEGTKHQRRTWQGWSLVEQAGHRLGKKRAETWTPAGSPLASVQRSSWTEASCSEVEWQLSRVWIQRG
jgi:hypothetical protein